MNLPKNSYPRISKDMDYSLKVAHEYYRINIKIIILKYKSKSKSRKSTNSYVNKLLLETSLENMKSESKAIFSDAADMIYNVSYDVDFNMLIFGKLIINIFKKSLLNRVIIEKIWVRLVWLLKEESLIFLETENILIGLHIEHTIPIFGYIKKLMTQINRSYSLGTVRKNGLETFVAVKNMDPDNPHLITTESGDKNTNSSMNFIVTRIVQPFTQIKHMLTPLSSYMNSFMEIAGKLIRSLTTGSSISRIGLLISIVIIEQFYHKLPIVRTMDIIKDFDLLKKLERYMTINNAVHGKLMAIYSKRNQFYKDIIKNTRKLIKDDLNIQDSDIFKLSLSENGPFKPCYMIINDKVIESTVLAIRGTMSLADSITDLNCNYIPYRNGVIHEGFFKSALWMIDRVMPMLDRAHAKYGSKNLVITGFSLGGGVCSMMAILLHKSRPDIQFISFGCPPTVSKELLPYSYSCLKTYNYGLDIVPRLSQGSIRDFKEMLIYIYNKYKSTPCKRFNDFLSTTFVEFQEFRRSLLVSDVNPKLYAPGDYYHIHKICFDGSGRYIIEKSKSIYFSEMYLITNMVYNHIPKAYITALGFQCKKELA